MTSGQPEADVQARERYVTDREPGLFGNTATATFNEARTHRFLLTRTWDEHWPPVTFIMLNPSKASAFESDPTCTRVTGFARRWHAGGFAIVNLFALQATDPKALRGHPDPVGAGNDRFIIGACTGAAVIVAAWGAHGRYLGRDREVTALLTGLGAELQCLGVTSGGQPRHPLYVRADAPLVPYEPGAGT